MTGTEVMRRVSITWSAAAASRSPEMVTGSRVMISRAVRPLMSSSTHHQAAQVAVGDQAGQRAVAIGHAGHAESLATHLVDHVAQRRLFVDARHAVAGVHQLLDAHQALAERPAG